jgi:hypothetical protein
MAINKNLVHEIPQASSEEIRKLRERIKELEQHKTKEKPEETRKEMSSQETGMPQMKTPVPTDNQQATANVQNDQLVPVNIPNDDDLANQIKNLVKVALTQGLAPAINQAVQLKNPYVLDELHDTLVDHLYDELIRMRRISKD